MKELKKNDRNKTWNGTTSASKRERRWTDGDSIGVDRMNITVETYNDLMRDYIKVQNKLQDIGFVLADAAQHPADRSPAGMYIKEIVKIWERD